MRPSLRCLLLLHKVTSDLPHIRDAKFKLQQVKELSRIHTWDERSRMIINRHQPPPPPPQQQPTPLCSKPRLQQISLCPNHFTYSNPCHSFLTPPPLVCPSTSSGAQTDKPKLIMLSRVMLKCALNVGWGKGARISLLLTKLHHALPSAHFRCTWHAFPWILATTQRD